MISLSKIKMGVLENLWDDVVAGPQPEARGRGHLRRISTGLTGLNNTKGKLKHLRFEYDIMMFYNSHIHIHIYIYIYIYIYIFFIIYMCS